jgi:hypothetical protein
LLVGGMIFRLAQLWFGINCWVIIGIVELLDYFDAQQWFGIV